MIREAEQQQFPGGIGFSSRVAVAPEGGWNVDLLRWRTGTDLVPVSPEEGTRSRVQWERYFPHLMLRQASNASASLTMPSLSQLRFVDQVGDTIEITLDTATHRPVRAVQIVNGSPQAELAYSNYEARHGVMMPGRVQLSSGGRVVEDVNLGTTRIGRPEDERFAPPAGYASPPAQGQPSAREIAPSVFYFENMPGDYHSLAVDAGDHIVLVEAPLNPAYAAHQRRILSELRPNKPVRYVLVTHHHGDHTGGLIAWMETGATIVVPAGARVAIERQLRARGFTGEPRIEEVASQRSFGSGASRIDAHRFSSTHSEAHMVMHLPTHRILFQGDLSYLPARGAPPRPFPVVAELDQLIRTLMLNVATVIGVHGRAGTVAEIRESLRRVVAGPAPYLRAALARNPGWVGSARALNSLTGSEVDARAERPQRVESGRTRLTPRGCF
jgi:glyoxylase-like metal-dependent hydrolase (beta-lactamase superfamily II)